MRRMLTSVTTATLALIAFGGAVAPAAGATRAPATTAPVVCGAESPKAGSGVPGAFPGNKDADPDLTMIPDTATKIACLDYDVPPLTPPTSPTDWQQQWGAYSGSCPETTKFELDHTILRKPPKDSTHYLNSMHYTVSGTCTKEDPIIGTGGISRRAEISSHVQATDAVEGDERWYYLAIRPEVGTLPPEVNYFLVTQWHPKTNRSPALSINFHQSDVEIGETHD